MMPHFGMKLNIRYSDFDPGYWGVNHETAESFAELLNMTYQGEPVDIDDVVDLNNRDHRTLAALEEIYEPLFESLGAATDSVEFYQTMNQAGEPENTVATIMLNGREYEMPRGKGTKPEKLAVMFDRVYAEVKKLVAED